MDSISNGLSKIDNPDIKTDKSHLKAAPKYFEISWKTYRITAFIIFILTFGIMKYIVDYFKETIEDEELINIIKIVSFFFILNFGTFLFINVYYKYRKSIKGATGPSGTGGRRGRQGKTSYCNTCEKKTASFKREYDMEPMKEEVVVSPLLLTFNDTESPKWKHISENIQLTKSFRLLIPSYLGPGAPDGLTITPLTLPTNVNGANNPIIGVSASFNKDTGELYSLMYLQDKNKTHNPRKYKFSPFGSVAGQVDQGFGRTDKKGESVEINCRPNSAINKVEVFHNGVIIKSIRFYAADVNTGEPVKILDPATSKMRKYATLGINVSRSDPTIISELSECSGFVYQGKYYPVFFSQVGAYQEVDSDQIKKIYSLGFLKCAVYQSGFTIT
jgi:hypothetical protein